MYIKGMAFIMGCLFSLAGYAEPIGEAVWAGYRPVLSLLGGVAGEDTTHSQTFNDGLFVYHGLENGTSSFLGGFLGVEHPFHYQSLFMQLGIEYNYFWDIPIYGLSSVGEPETYTNYTYDYILQTQQALAVAKFFTSVELLTIPSHIFYPYVSVGLGVAFNHSSQYNTAPQGTECANLPPVFGNNMNVNLSYSVGLGVDTNITQHIRVGLGYQFSHFGRASLHSGEIVFNNYYFPTNFALNVPNVVANQFLAQVSYLF